MKRHKYSAEVTPYSNSPEVENDVVHSLTSPTVPRHYMPHCPLIKKYCCMEKIGQGTFGEVFRARERANLSAVVAIKKITSSIHSEGFPITALREINILKNLKHENVLILLEVCADEMVLGSGILPGIYMIFEYCEHDLAGLLTNSTIKFSLGDIKSILKQLFNGIFYIHLNKLMHRDLKPANILITKYGVLKIADYGLARSKPARPHNLTTCVVSLWYRPPEIILDYKSYGYEVDLWSAGCIVTELFTRTALLKGNSEQDQLQKITELCGSISEDVWPNVKKIKKYHEIRKNKDKVERKLRQVLSPQISDPCGLDLIDKLLVLDPAKRLTACQALDHDFFWTGVDLSDLRFKMSQYSEHMKEYNQIQFKIADDMKSDSSLSSFDDIYI